MSKYITIAIKNLVVVGLLVAGAVKVVKTFEPYSAPLAKLNVAWKAR